MFAPLLFAVLILQADDASTRLAEGRFGRALDAAAGGLFEPADPRFSARPLTVELWALLKDAGREAVLVSQNERASGDHWELFAEAETGRIGLRLAGARPSTLIADASIADGDWHHLAVQLEERRAAIFLDGERCLEADLEPRSQPVRASGLGIGTRIEDRTPQAVRIDDLRISAGIRDAIVRPTAPLSKDDRTLALWDFDQTSEEDLDRWTPGGATNQRGLPYAHRYADYEFEIDADWIDGRWQQTVKGPFVTHSTRLPDREVGPKALTVFLAEDASTAALFDLDRCGFVAGVTSASFTIDPARFGLLRKPTLGGDLQFDVPPPKVWRRPLGDRLAPLDRNDLDYQGLSLHNDRVLLISELLKGKVAESCVRLGDDDLSLIARQLRVEDTAEPVVLTIAELPDQPDQPAFRSLDIDLENGTSALVALESDDPDAALELRDGDVLLRIDAQSTWTGALVVWKGPSERLDEAQSWAASAVDLPSLATLEQPAGRRWGAPLETRGRLGQEDAPFVIDTIEIPFENRWNALFYLTGIGFFPNGDAAVATAHGDVWIVRGLDDDLDRVTWQRFATGLYQPLGLEIVDGLIYVLGRDQITRLRDINGDGEADFYEAFNNDLVITGQDHAFALRLERSPRNGRFYFLKSGDHPPHGASLLEVAPDGSSLRVFAKGFRHPYGMGMGPNGEITVADNEGNWVPTSKIDLIREGGFYGFLGAGADPDADLRPDPPLCYIPKVADNSSGGQVWYTGDRWGGYHQGGMLHLSWGRCSLHAVLRDRVNGVDQAATVRFPDLTFESGPGEAEFSPADGQLYVVGLDGWQTGAIADGCLERVRFTGKLIHMPSQLQFHGNGLLLSFSEPIDREIATDVRRYRAERWNYRWSNTYGSFHYSVADPDRIGHDTVEVLEAIPTADGRGVFLRIDEAVPVDQFALHTDLRAADGAPLRFDLYATVHALRPAWNDE